MSTSPDGLGPRGSALWESLARSPETPDGVLALEACRAADRLDELDSIIHGKGVLHLMRAESYCGRMRLTPASAGTPPGHDRLRRSRYA